MTTWVSSSKAKAGGVLAAILIALGIWAVIPDPKPAPPPSSTTTAKVVAPTVPWWRTDTTSLAISPDSDRLVANLVDHGSMSGPGQIAPEMCISNGNSYCAPEYDISTAQGTRPLYRKAGFNGYFNLPLGSQQPVSSAWIPAQGKDAFLHLYDPQTGHGWGFWNWSWGGYQTDVDSQLACTINGDNIAAGFLTVGWGGSVCAASAYEVTDPKGVPVDLRTYNGNFPGASGGGWHLRSPGPAQVASGDIGTALHLTTVNTMFGPICTGALDPTSCGWAVAPAGQFERAGGFGTTSTDPATIAATSNPANTIPEGTRFALRLTDTQIEQWLDSRGYTGTLRATARTIARGLRTYGMFLGDSSAYGASLGFSQGDWASLGVVGDGKTLLDGLFTKTDLVAMTPPTQTCADGTTSTLACWSTDVRYP